MKDFMQQQRRFEKLPSGFYPLRGGVPPHSTKLFWPQWWRIYVQISNSIYDSSSNIYLLNSYKINFNFTPSASGLVSDPAHLRSQLLVVDGNLKYWYFWAAPGMRDASFSKLKVAPAHGWAQPSSLRSPSASWRGPHAASSAPSPLLTTVEWHL